MPDFQLSPEEAGQLSAYLLEESARDELERLPPGDPASGRRLVSALGCGNCHPCSSETGHLLETTPLVDLEGLDWDLWGCLASGDGRGDAPRFAFSPAQRAALLVFGSTDLSSLRRSVPAEFSVVVRGRGVHASQPQEGRDPVLASAHIVAALQSIISRNTHYQDRAVVSVTTIHGGEAFNVIPDAVTLGGTVRALSEESYHLIETRIAEIATGTALAMGCSAEVSIDRMYPVLVNAPGPTALVERIGREILGGVSSEMLPMLGAEDFAYYLQRRPGCFFFLGGGEEGRSNAICHATDYDFNDNLIGVGVRFWMKLVEARLGVTLL